MRDPLWQLQQAIYTRLDTDLTATVYDWLPNPPTLPYVLMETETSDESELSKDMSLSGCSITLLVVSASKGGQELKELVDDVLTSMATTLTLTGDWKVIRQKGRPRVTTFRAETSDKSPARAARLVYTFDIQDVQ